MKIHELKCMPDFFEAVADGSKTFEIRYNDRDFKVGDVLHLKSWISVLSKFTGEELLLKVTYILPHSQFPQGIQPGYCILGVKSLDVNGGKP